MAELAGQTIEKILKQRGLLLNVMRHKCALLWNEVIGEKISSKTEVLGVSGSCLVVFVESASWRQELHMMKPRLLQNLATKAGDNYIEDIRFVASRAQRTWDKQSRGSINQTEALARVAHVEIGQAEVEKIDNIVTAVCDSRLKDSAKRFFLTLCKRDLFLRRRGYVRCRLCGSLAPKDTCPVCAEQLENDKFSRALEILSRLPWLDAEGLRKVDPELSEEEYSSARDTLLSWWSSEARALSAKRTKRAIQVARMNLSLITMLTKNVSPDQLTEELVSESVSPRLAKACGFLKGS